MGQCKPEHRGFKKTKERTWDSANLGAKTLREIMLKKKPREIMGQSASKERGFKE
jgi:hypothetical protein